MLTSRCFLINQDSAGKRLDHVLAAHLPELGLRGCRRLIEGARVLVNGKRARPAYKLRGGERLELQCPEAQPVEAPRILARQDDFVFLYKPAGLSSVSLGGAFGPSLEQGAAILPDKPRLLQRLDWGTSGIVSAARSEHGALAFRLFEGRGLCDKHYLAILTGFLREEKTEERALDTCDRKKTRVLRGKAEKIYWTSFKPLWHWEKELAGYGAGPLTLAICSIKKGQRHQIRAHAAALGYPLLGDALYGNPGNGFFLEHFAITWPLASHIFLEEDSLWGRLGKPAVADLLGWARARGFHPFM